MKVKPCPHRFYSKTVLVLEIEDDMGVYYSLSDVPPDREPHEYAEELILTLREHDIFVKDYQIEGVQ